ncbi:coiled-coil domain-containing protein 57 [Ambystoma mexicanum]|uniref:coiled-coil domain-containing protein 57 n=1 Tax=Ambystoma mexicanum TaxID=8296 RepID=UPI0037E7CCBD
MQPEDELAQLLASKEQEWKDLQARRVSLLESSLKDTKSQLQEQGQKFSRLKEDFTYNLHLLEERDRELERYDSMFSRLKAVENAKLAEVSELKIQIEKLQRAVNEESRHREDLELQYQRRLKEHQLELERMRSSKEADIDRHLEEYEKLKRQLERKIQEVEGELALQKQELMMEFDAEMKKREHEFRLKMDEMSTLVLSHELKVKLLTKELDVLRESGIKAAESLQSADAANMDLEKELKQRDWELKDITAVKDARIKDLKNKLHDIQLSWKKEEEIFQRKHEQLDRFAREKDAALKAIKEAHAEQERELEKRVRELQVARDTLEMEQRRMQWMHSDTLAEKEAAIEKLQGEIQTVKSAWDSHITQISSETVSKDLQIQSMEEEEVKLKAELARCHQDVERYKQQLSQSVERERLLERAKVQAELDWQKRCENAERIQYQKSEEVIECLTRARDQACAELQEKERILQEKEAIQSALTIERDRAVHALQLHGVLPERESQALPTDEPWRPEMDFTSNEMRKLQEQNSGLRAVIAEMRKEMEALSEPNVPFTKRTDKSEDFKQTVTISNTATDSTDPGYVRSLEDEIRNLKQKCRNMEKHLEDLAKAPKKSPPATPVPKVSAENAYIQSHVRALNETIGALRADKVVSAAATKKLEARAAHLDSMVTQLTQKLRQKQVEVDQVHYELTNHTQRSSSELSAALQRVAELELQLTEARKEADEYFKGNLQQNMEAVALGNEVSSLKLDLACNRAPVVVKQSSVIKQLQEEILSLRQKLNSAHVSGDGLQQNMGLEVQLLLSTLRDAASRITRLSREKEQLIDLGNRLRAELVSVGREGFTPSAASGPSSHAVPSTSQPVHRGHEAESHLSALEHLQYQLTTQELQYAQRQHFMRTPDNSHPSSAESLHLQYSQHKPSDRKDPSGPKHQAQSSIAKKTSIHVKENTPPDRRQRQNLSRIKDGLPQLPAMSLSGEEGALQDVWQILEMGSSPSILSSQDNMEHGDSQQTRDGTPMEETTGPPKISQSPFTVTGKRFEVQPKPKFNKSFQDSAGKNRSTQISRKIRNYNVRD